jgi:hypothetical protein
MNCRKGHTVLTGLSEKESALHDDMEARNQHDEDSKHTIKPPLQVPALNPHHL